MLYIGFRGFRELTVNGGTGLGGFDWFRAFRELTVNGGTVSGGFGCF